MKHRRNRTFRRGVAVVEFAVCLPIVVLLMLGAVEAARALMVQHALQEAVQAGCRVYSVLDVPTQKAVDIINQSLTAEGITNYTLNFSPAFKNDIDTDLEPVTITATVNYSDVSWLAPTFMAGTTISGQCTMPADLGEESGDTSGYSDPNQDDNVADGILRFDDPPPPSGDDD